VLAQTLTDSSAQVSLIILAFSAPAVLFGSFAGVVVDRLDKRSVMVASMTVRGAAVITYITALSAADMPAVYLASFVFASAAQFFAPAEGAVIPRILGGNQLIAANSLYNLTNLGSQFVGFVLLGWLLLRALGLRGLFILAFCVYILAAAVLASLRIPTLPGERGEDAGPTRLWGDLLEGWGFIARRRALAVTIAHLAIANSVYLMLATLGPAFVSRVLRVRAADLGILLAPAGMFTLLGVLAVNRLAKRSNRHSMIHAGLTGLGLSILGLALLEPLSRFGSLVGGSPVSPGLITGLAILFSMPFGFCVAFIAIPAQTVLQENSPDEVRGRVLSTFFTVSNAAAFLPILLAGAVADRLGLLQTMAYVGMFVFSVGVWSHRRYLARGGSWD
jgi:MFS family permease